MRSEEEFEAFLQDTLLPELVLRKREWADLRRRREALRLPATARLAIWAIGVGLALWARSFEGLLAAVAAPFVIDVWRMRAVPLPRTGPVKAEWVGRVVSFLDPSFDYQPHGCVPRAALEASRLFDGRIDAFGGEDLVTGKHRTTRFRFSEVRAVRFEGSGKNRREVTVFTGLFMVADFNKHFEHPLWVLPDATERHLGLLGRALQSLPGHGRGALMQLESPEFERCFVVYGSDPVEARYILSPSLMRRLVRFRETTNDGLRLAFLGGSLYLALPLPGDLFSVGSLEALDDRVLRSWAVDLAFATGILDELDLDTRIWSKAAD